MVWKKVDNLVVYLDGHEVEKKGNRSDSSLVVKWILNLDGQSVVSMELEKVEKKVKISVDEKVDSLAYEAVAL